MLLIAFGLITGLALGLTGGGGSIFAVPLLLYGAHVEVAQAVAMSALAVGAASLVGGVQGLRKGRVDPRTALLFAISGALAAPIGVRAGGFIPDETRILIFGLLLLILGVLMWRKAKTPAAQVIRATVFRDSQQDGPGPACRYSPEGKLRLTAPCAFVLAAGGLATGLLSGLFGVGGGFLIVPTLRATAGLDMHRAVATSLLIIALVSASTVLASWAHTRSFDLSLTALFAAGGIGGLLIGALFAARIAGPTLQRTFAGLIVVVGAALLLR